MSRQRLQNVSYVKIVGASTRTEKQKVGQLGEDIACRYLDAKGFLVIERNFRRKWGEIDVIATRGSLLHFIEVKTVLSGFFEINEIDSYRPEENVHPRKLKRLARVVETYLTKQIVDREWQFDVITVCLDRGGKKARVRCFEDIVL